MQHIDTDSLVVARLEELIQPRADTLAALKGQRGSQGDPDIKTERSYFTRQMNAYKRALGYWLAGVRPTQLPSGAYLVPSGSKPGASPYRVERLGDVWACDGTCPSHEQFHWHTAIVAVLESLPEFAAQHDDAPLADEDAPPMVDPWQQPDFDEPWLPGAAPSRPIVVCAPDDLCSPDAPCAEHAELAAQLRTAGVSTAYDLEQQRLASALIDRITVARRRLQEAA